jgi:hypothetical protein
MNDDQDDDNYEPEGDQLSAYSWVEEGCYKYR